MGAGLVVGLTAFLVGFGVTFAGVRLRGRIVGLSVMAVTALAVVAAAPPESSWVAAAAVAVTLGPLLLVAVVLRRRIEHAAGDEVTLDDEPR